MVNLDKFSEGESKQPFKEPEPVSQPELVVQPTVVNDTIPTKFCFKCAATLPENADVCAFCGAEQPIMQRSVPQQIPMPQPTIQPTVQPTMHTEATKYCKFCAAKIPIDAVVCTSCGRQVEELSQKSQPTQQVFINNAPQNVNNTNIRYNPVPAGKRPISKWTAFWLCLFLGYFGVHKFYEGKIGWGLLYLFTGGLGGIGWLIDIIAILGKTDPYYKD